MKVKRIVCVALFVASLAWGCNQSGSDLQESNEIEQSTQEEREPVQEQQKQIPGQQAAPSGEADEYGRMPGDEHYGHNHPPQDQQPLDTTNQLQQETKPGEADKYGRMPGDEHYGHDHP